MKSDIDLSINSTAEPKESWPPDGMRVFSYVYIHSLQEQIKLIIDAREDQFCISWSRMRLPLDVKECSFLIRASNKAEGMRYRCDKYGTWGHASNEKAFYRLSRSNIYKRLQRLDKPCNTDILVRIKYFTHPKSDFFKRRVTEVQMHQNSPEIRVLVQYVWLCPPFDIPFVPHGLSTSATNPYFRNPNSFTLKPKMIKLPEPEEDVEQIVDKHEVKFLEQKPSIKFESELFKIFNPTSPSIDIPILDKSNVESIFQCAICDYHNDSLNEIKIHVCEHLNWYPYQCALCLHCDVSFSRIRRHSQEKHPDKLAHPIKMIPDFESLYENGPIWVEFEELFFEAMYNPIKEIQATAAVDALKILPLPSNKKSSSKRKSKISHSSVKCIKLEENSEVTKMNDTSRQKLETITEVSELVNIICQRCKNPVPLDQNYNMVDQHINQCVVLPFEADWVCSHPSCSHQYSAEIDCLEHMVAEHSHSSPTLYGEKLACSFRECYFMARKHSEMLSHMTRFHAARQRNCNQCFPSLVDSTTKQRKATVVCESCRSRVTLTEKASHTLFCHAFGPKHLNLMPRFECNVCTARFDSFDLIQAHIKQHHDNDGDCRDRWLTILTQAQHLIHTTLFSNFLGHVYL